MKTEPSPAPENRSLSRRDFLLRSLKASALIAASGAAAAWLHDPNGPVATTPSAVSSVLLPDFSVAGSGSRMSIITGEDRVQSVQLGLKEMGGIEAFIRPGDRVLIKVNAAFATPAALCATTHPQLVAEVARLCFKAGASSVVVTDNPINNPESCFALTGIGEAARSTGAGVMLPTEASFRPTTVPGTTLIQDWPLLYTPFEGVNKLIGIAPVKDHHRSVASMTMKNWYGLLGGRRNIFHQNIHQFISELSMMVKPTLVILDGTMTMMSNGPTGGSISDLKRTNTMIVSTDQVAADALGATLLGRKSQDIPYLQKAEAAGVGLVDYESLKPVRARVDRV